MKPSLWHNIEIGFPCGVVGGILITLIGWPWGLAAGAVTTLALVLAADWVDRFVRFDYAAAVQAGIDHDRLADLLRPLGDSPRAYPPTGRSCRS